VRAKLDATAGPAICARRINAYSLRPKSIMNRFILTVAVLLLQGCSSYARLTYEFDEMTGTPRIYFDLEAKDIAEQAQKSLPDNISSVVNKQYVEFKDLGALKVYVFSTKERYSSFSGSTPNARGSAVKNEIYISPIIRERIETLDEIITHELSHVHLRQYIGTWRYWTEVPGWFHEGLAVEVSGGGGAEKVSDEQAITAIRSGNYFIPRAGSSLLGHKYASDYGLKHQMYYRQSNLFVRYLMNQNPEAFKEVFLALIGGTSFKEVWALKYSKSITVLWQEFLNHIQA
jgi:hypothetical protein